MAERFRILDADVHATEPHDLWQKYLEPGFRHLAPTYRRKELPEEDWNTRTVRMARLYLEGQRAGVPPEVVDRALENATPPLSHLEVGGELLIDNPSVQRVWNQAASESIIRYAPLQAENFSAAAYAQTLRALGVEHSFVYPSAGLLLLAVDGMDPRLAVAMMRAYNDWLHDFC